MGPGMGEREYLVPRSERLALWFAFGFFTVVCLAGAIIAATRDQGAVMGVALAAVLGGVIGFRPTFQGTSRRLVLSESGIEGWNYLGRHTRLAWEEVGELQESGRFYGPRLMFVFRLISADRTRRIGFTSHIPEYQEIASEVRRRVNLTPRKPPWWEQIS
jgi:hypothetical protein